MPGRSVIQQAFGTRSHLQRDIDVHPTVALTAVRCPLAHSRVAWTSTGQQDGRTTLRKHRLPHTELVTGKLRVLRNVHCRKRYEQQGRGTKTLRQESHRLDASSQSGALENDIGNATAQQLAKVEKNITRFVIRSPIPWHMIVPPERPAFADRSLGTWTNRHAFTQMSCWKNMGQGNICL